MSQWLNTVTFIIIVMKMIMMQTFQMSLNSCYLACTDSLLTFTWQWRSEVWLHHFKLEDVSRLWTSHTQHEVNTSTLQHPWPVHGVRLLQTRAGYLRYQSNLSPALLQRFCNACSGWSLTTVRLEAESPQVRGCGLRVQEQAHLVKKHYLKQKDVLLHTLIWVALPPHIEL